MQTIREWIYQRLRDDSTIQTLTGVSATPYNVYSEFPKKDIDFSTKHALFIREDSSIPLFVDPDDGRTILYIVTAKGPALSTIESLLNRTNQLLHDLYAEDMGDSPRKILSILWDWTSPDLYDTGKEAWFKQQRYKVEAQIPRAR